jgi:hypothetical protein
MRNAYQTLCNKPINWEHGEPNIGVITKAFLVEGNKTQPLHITCQGTVWAWKYPAEADAIVASAQLGELGYGDAAEYATSMEVYFRDANYVIGDYDEVYPATESNRDLESLLGMTFRGKLISRELKDIFFGGAAVTATPAEKRAWLKAVATNRRSDGRETYAELSDADFALAEVRMFPIDTVEHAINSLQYFDTVADELISQHGLIVALATHDKLVKIAERAGNVEDLAIHSASCALCNPNIMSISASAEGGNGNMGSSSVMESIVKEESEETMGDEKNTSAEEVEAVVEETAVEATDESVVPEAGLEAEATAEEADVEEAQAEETFTVESAFKQLHEMLSRLMPQDAEASEAEVEEEAKDELTLANERIKELETQLAEANQRTEQVEKDMLGFTRLVELTKAGITVDKASEQAKREFLASLSEDGFKTYFADVTSTKANEEVVEDEEDDEVDTSLASLADSDETEDKLSDYHARTRGFWG